jgi:hypothetical protein
LKYSTDVIYAIESLNREWAIFVHLLFGDALKLCINDAANCMQAYMKRISERQNY